MYRAYRFITALMLLLLSGSLAFAANLLHTQTVALAASLSVPNATLLNGFEVQADSTLSAAAWWVLLFNSSTVPGDGAVTPDKCYPMLTGETRFNASWPNPLSFGKGVVVVVSTNGCFTKAASAHAFIGVDFQ